jgi:hypothetical protein
LELVDPLGTNMVLGKVTIDEEYDQESDLTEQDMTLKEKNANDVLLKTIKDVEDHVQRFPTYYIRRYFFQHIITSENFIQLEDDWKATLH